jgi:hypothetical protein
MYTRMMDRWWPAVFALALGLFALAWALHSYFPEPASYWRWMTIAALGGLSLFFSFLLFLVRKAAFVQARSDYLLLATPFLRLKISYKRIRRATSATMAGLFPPSSVSDWRREIIEPLGSRSAVVVELNGYPISQAALRYFLSPFFFKDKTPHFVLLVDDWMRFSAELESMRAGGGVEQPRPRRANKSILSRLPHQ